MNERRIARDVRINVLRADEVGVFHCMLKLALQLDRAGAPLRSVRLGCFDYTGPDGRIAHMNADVMAAIFELPAAVVASTIATLLELKVLARDGATLWIEDAADWFVPLDEHPALRNEAATAPPARGTAGGEGEERTQTSDDPPAPFGACACRSFESRCPRTTIRVTPPPSVTASIARSSKP